MEVYTLHRSIFGIHRCEFQCSLERLRCRFRWHALSRFHSWQGWTMVDERHLPRKSEQDCAMRCA